MRILGSATRIAMLWLVICLPVLVWFGKVQVDVFTNALMLILGGFFGTKMVQSADTPK